MSFFAGDIPKVDRGPDVPDLVPSAFSFLDISRTCELIHNLLCLGDLPGLLFRELNDVRHLLERHPDHPQLSPGLLSFIFGRMDLGLMEGATGGESDCYDVSFTT